MKLFILGICILVATQAADVKPKALGPNYTYTYDQYNLMGFYHVFLDYTPDLSLYAFENTICSVQQTGMWIYYENKQYNNVFSGSVYWVHGIDYVNNFPFGVCDTTSSLKYAGNHYSWNEDSYTLYEGEYFTGDEFYGNINTTTLTILNDAASSLILTGVSPWTFYTGLSYTGMAYCFYPNTDVDVGLDGSVLNFGIYPSLASLGVPDNSFNSVMKGCFASTVIRAEPMKAVERTKNGAWGVIEL